MHITWCDDYDTLTARATAFVQAAIERQPDLLLCPATGASAAGVYGALARHAARDPAPFARLRVVMLDEWGGLTDDDPACGTAQLRSVLLDPLRISPDRYLGFRSAAPDPAAECKRVGAALAAWGPIDLCVLGLGMNGHLGFNEPGPSLVPDCHVASLTDITRQHAMMRDKPTPPTYGFTLGMREILASRRVLLLATGTRKADAIAALLAGAVTTAVPATLLQLHPNVECVIDARAVPDRAGIGRGSDAERPPTA